MNKFVMMEERTGRFEIYSLIVFVLLFGNTLFSQAKFDIRIGAPININKSFYQYISNEYSFNSRFSIALNMGFNYHLKKGYFFLADIQLNNYFFSSNTASLKLLQANSLGGIGKEFQINDKFKFGAIVNFGASMSSQLWYITSEKISYFQSLKSSNYSISQSDVKIKFYLGTDFYLSYSLGRSANLFFGIKNSLLPMKKLDFIDNQSIYGFYLCPYIGVRDIHFRLKNKADE